MSLKAIGGIFLRLDANGNLNAYDSSGNIVFQVVANAGPVVSNLPLSQGVGNNAVTTTSTSYVSSSYGVVIPIYNPGGQYTQALVTFIAKCDIANSIIGDGMQVSLGSVIGPTSNLIPALGVVSSPLPARSFSATQEGLAGNFENVVFAEELSFIIGVNLYAAAWFVFSAITGGTVSLKNASILAWQTGFV